MIGHLLVLIGGSLAFWLLVALPARHLGGGDQAVLSSGTAVLICLIPAGVTLALAERSIRRDPSQVVLAALGGTGVRMVGVFLTGLLLTRAVPLYREDSHFWTWLLVAYLFTLALEVSLVLTAAQARASRRID